MRGGDAWGQTSPPQPQPPSSVASLQLRTEVASSPGPASHHSASPPPPGAAPHWLAGADSAAIGGRGGSLQFQGLPGSLRIKQLRCSLVMLSLLCPPLPRLLVSVVWPHRGVGGAVCRAAASWASPGTGRGQSKLMTAMRSRPAGRPTQHHHQSRARTANFLAIDLFKSTHSFNFADVGS